MLDRETIMARVLHRDGDLLVINKPNRLPLYKGPGGGPVLADYLDLLRGELPEAPAPVHRLDASTSGCLVLGRHREARRAMSDLFAGGGVEKVYWAVVAGCPLDLEGTITLPLKDAGWPGRPRMVVANDGKLAETAYRVLAQGEGTSWLRLTPRTGRTHQLRLHCAASGFPIIGDPLYGGAPPGAETRPLHLHARHIAFTWNGTEVRVQAPPPPHMMAALAAMGLKALFQELDPLPEQRPMVKAG